YNLEEGFAVVSATRAPGFQYAKSKEVGVFYWKAPALPGRALPSGTPMELDQKPQDCHQQPDHAHQSVDADRILAEFSAYAGSENDSDRLKHRYEDTWKLLN
ncbi:recombinase, partial [Escherichia coli]